VVKGKKKATEQVKKAKKLAKTDPNQAAKKAAAAVDKADQTGKKRAGGLEFEPSKHTDTGMRKLAKSGGDWSRLTGKESRAVGTFLHRVMEGLVARLAADKWNVVRREAITPSSIKAWRKAGRRVLLVEARLPKDGRMPRLDLAEIDFSAKRIKVHDYAPTSDSAHWKKPAPTQTNSRS